MKTILVINHHSFVDLITNSSSELFVCNTQKTVTQVKKILKKIVETTNELGGTSKSFEDCFGEIKEAKFTYDISLFNNDVLKAYELYDTSFYYSGHGSSPYQAEYYKECKEAEEKLQAIHPYFTAPNRKKNHADLTKSEIKEIEEQGADYWKQSDILWTPYGAKKLEVSCDLFIDFMRINQFSEKDIQKVTDISMNAVLLYGKEQRGRFVDLSFLKTVKGFPKKLHEALSSFIEAQSWGMTINKGAILIYSNGDNSIPYETFDLIENYLHAERYHLG